MGSLGQFVAYMLTGLVGGILSGLFGIGGGVIIIPILVLLFGMNQHSAQGTTLALFVPPIGFLAAWTYYREGLVDLKVAGLLCIGFFLGGFLGGQACSLLLRHPAKTAFRLHHASHSSKNDLRQVEPQGDQKVPVG